MDNARKIAHNILLLVVLVSMLTGCDRIRKALGREDADAAPAATEDQSIMFAVSTATATEGPISDYIAVSGDIIARTQGDAFSETAGRIAEVNVVVGQMVRRGQRIAAVDPSRPGMTFQLSAVEAPISGRIFALPAKVGMTVSPALPLARIAGGNALEIQLFVAERFISRMALNLPCEVTLDAWPGEVFQGNIREVAPLVDPLSRTLEVRVNVRDPSNLLKAGMFARVRVITEQKGNVVKIPASATLTQAGSMFVYVAENDPANPGQRVARRRTIVPGISIDGMLEVQSGLSPNDEIVVRGQTLLDDGVRINIVDHVTLTNTR
jgi:multidrug efflux pump subunit AcrA (membrane-fusion protein)